MAKSILEALQFYAYSLIQLLIEPGLFFRELDQKTTGKRAIGFMVICSIFFAVASLLTGVYDRSVFQMAVIFFVNAAGMIVLSSILGYTILIMILKTRTSFPIIFGLYAFASGVTLFLSWLPFLLWFTEPWKWWLIYTGFKNTCNLTWKQALITMLASVTIQFFLIYSAFMAFGN